MFKEVYIVSNNAADVIKKCKNGLNTKDFRPPSKYLQKPPTYLQKPPKTSKNLRPTSEYSFIMFPFVCKTNSF